MITASVAATRKLRELFERQLGLSIWDQGKVSVRHGEDDEVESLVYRGEVNGRRYAIRVVSTDDHPPLGLMELTLGAKAVAAGAFDDLTFASFKPHLTGDFHEE
jgi:hypothetical protein